MGDSSSQLHLISKKLDTSAMVKNMLSLTPPLCPSLKKGESNGESEFLSLFIVCTFLLISSAIFSISTANAQGPDGPEAITVYLTEEQAIKKIFPDADTLWTEVWTPTQQERRRIERRLGWRLEETEFTIFQAKKNNQHQGYAIITHQIGLYKPITFMVHVKIDGRVGSVWIMVYRESRGGQVRRQRFLTQYKNKKTDSHIRLNRDIVGISGATLSVRALNAGVKKILTVIDVAYSQKESP